MKFKTRKNKDVYHDTTNFWYWRKVHNLKHESKIQFSRRLDFECFMPSIKIEDGFLMCDVNLN